MSDAGDDIPVEVAEVEVTAEAPKGKLSVEDALQVRGLCPISCIVNSDIWFNIASFEERPRP